MINEWILEHQEGQIIKRGEKWVNTVGFLTPPEVSKLYLMIKAKV